eukprot:g4650.t1
MKEYSSYPTQTRLSSTGIAFLPVSDTSLMVTEVEWSFPYTSSDPNKLPNLEWRRSDTIHSPDLVTLQQGDHIVGVDHIGQFLESLKLYNTVPVLYPELESHAGRELKFLSLDARDLDLDIGGILKKGPKLALETPDVSVGLEGLFSTLARATLGGLASQFTGGLFNPAGSGAVNPAFVSTATPQMKGVQQQYQLQFNRGPWNIQSGFQVGLQARDTPNGPLFTNPVSYQQPPPPGSNANQQQQPYIGGSQQQPYSGGDQQQSYSGGGQQQPYSGGGQQQPYSGGDQQQSYFGGGQQPPEGGYGDPQTVFQQTSDVYYGQGFTEGYDQGYSSGSSSGTMSTPSGALPPLSSNSPPGFNEGVVAGFTRGLQDGYYAGYQAWRSSSSAGQQGAYTGLASTRLPTANSLPRALPHVSEQGRLPTELYEAQLAAFRAYDTNFQKPAFDQELLAQMNQASMQFYPQQTQTQTQNTLRSDERQSSDSQNENKQIEDPESGFTGDNGSSKDLVEELKSRQSRLDLNQETSESLGAPLGETSEVSNGSGSSTEGGTGSKKDTRIAGMELKVAVIVFSALLFFLVLFCILAIGCFTSRRKSKEKKVVMKLSPLKSKVSDIAEVSAYMKNPTIFDSYIQPLSDHKASQAKRMAGTKE